MAGWVAYALIAIGPDGSWWPGWLALGRPVFMYGLLVHVSGIPPLEAHMLRSRGEAYRASEARERLLALPAFSQENADELVASLIRAETPLPDPLTGRGRSAGLRRRSLIDGPTAMPISPA
jgi:hypothetical protein